MHILIRSLLHPNSFTTISCRSDSVLKYSSQRQYENFLLKTQKKTYTEISLTIFESQCYGVQHTAHKENSGVDTFTAEYVQINDNIEQGWSIVTHRCEKGEGTQVVPE